MGTSDIHLIENRLVAAATKRRKGRRFQTKPFVIMIKIKLRIICFPA